MARLTDEQADRVFESNLLRQESALERKLNANFNQLSKDIQAMLESYDTAGAEAVVSLNDIVLEQILLEAYEVGNSRGARMAATDLEEDESLVEEAVLLALLLWRIEAASRVSKEINRTTRKVFDEVFIEVIQEFNEFDAFEEFEEFDDMFQEGDGLSDGESLSDRLARVNQSVRDRLDRINNPKTPSQEKVSKEVAKRVKRRNRKRVKTIATTEAQRGTQEGANQAGIEVHQKVMKTWRSQRDKRVRPTHRRADGQTVNMNETFDVGRGQGRYPTDSMLPREESIGCRCYLRFKKMKI